MGVDSGADNVWIGVDKAFDTGCDRW